MTPASSAGAQRSTQPVVTVLVVDDSPGQRRFLTNALNDDPAFRVVGEAANGGDAVAMVERLRPAAVLMDLDLPVMNGLEAIERIMASRPTPIVVYSALVDGDGNANAAAATAAGAVDIVPKPAPGEAVVLDTYVLELRRRLRVASRARVITHPRGRLKQAMLAPAPSPKGNGTSNGYATSAPSKHVEGSTRARAPKPPPQQKVPGEEPTFDFEPLSTPISLVAIGASTGGPQALAQMLAELPADFVPAVLVVQHMADGFIEGLADWLDGLSPLPVVVGETGRRLLPGTVTVAPSGLNLIVHDRKLRVTCEPPPPSQYHVPGIDATFRSVAHSVGAEAIGLLLTGMGRDGAAGLKLLRDRGAVTIAQDEATSAVYGMPQAAHALGAVEYELPLEAMSRALVALLANQVTPDEVGA